MEFLGVGYQELFLVLVLLLVVVGPERLPAMAYQIGRAVRTMQQYARAVRSEFSEEFEYIEEQYRTVKGQVDDTRLALREEDRKLQAELRSASAVELPSLIAGEADRPGAGATSAGAERPPEERLPTAAAEGPAAAAEGPTASGAGAAGGTSGGAPPPLVF